MDRNTIIDGLKMTMELCVFDPSTGEEIEPHLLNDISRATYDACKGALEILERLPANNSEIPNSSDTISRAKAIEALAEDMPSTYTPDGSHPADEGIFMAQEIYADCIQTLKELPPAQSETAKRIIGKSKGGMTLWYQCDMCNEPVDVQDNFCRGCGRRLIDE